MEADSAMMFAISTSDAESLGRSPTNRRASPVGGPLASPARDCATDASVDAARRTAVMLFHPSRMMNLGGD